MTEKEAIQKFGRQVWAILKTDSKYKQTVIDIIYDLWPEEISRDPWFVKLEKTNMLEERLIRLWAESLLKEEEKGEEENTEAPNS